MVEAEDLEYSMKIIVVGNGVVGKTSLTQRFVKNIFTNEYKKTLGVDFLMKKKYIKPIDKEVEFMIWDTAGQEYYDSITKRYYKGASGALIVFSVTDKASFDNVKSWKEKIMAECDRIPIILIMNKIDLIDQAVITEQQAMSLAVDLELPLCKTSVKDNLMVNEVFDNLAIDFFKKGLHMNNTAITNMSDVNNNRINNNQSGKKEIREVENFNEPKKEPGFSLKPLPNKNVKEEKKKKKSICSIL